MTAMRPPVVREIVQQHVDDAVVLADARPALARAAHATLGNLRAADDRLAAHVDGILLAGEHGDVLCDALLETPSPGALFTAAVVALERRDEARMDRLLAVAQALPGAASGLQSAYGWVERSRLQGTVVGLLGSAEPFRQSVGLACCSMHRVDPGIQGRDYVRHPDAAVRARSFRMVGELGLRDLSAICDAASRGDDDPDVQFWAAWTGALLGERQTAVDALAARARLPGAHRERAFRLALQAMPLKSAHAMLQRLASDPGQRRWVVVGSGIAGDPAYVPWLLKQMSDRQMARIAGEAFTLITGIDLGTETLDQPAPVDFEAGPTDDPDDPDVTIDTDEDLTWPDPARVEEWWAEHGRRFSSGTRHFMGVPLTRGHCVTVLRHGRQRQRILAAHYLCLLEPGTPLFNTSAPAWRQQRLLTAMA
jgi:uncharacterized protein (TIGR02270 family)